MINDWMRILKRAWSIRVALFWGAMSGAYSALPAFQGAVAPGLFAGLSVFFSVLMVAARLTKQPGATDDQ